jgi:polyisoprenoid-binding protein YceI
MDRTQHSVGTARALVDSAGTWLLDPSETTVELHTKAMWGTAKVKASFTVLEGAAVVGPEGEVTGTLVVDAASVDTGKRMRDKHLRSKDFFEVDSYPTFVYTVTAARVAEDNSVVFSGTLTVHGQTRPLEVRSVATVTGPNRVQLTGEADIDRSLWGLTWARMGARLDNHVVVTAAFTRT